MSVERPTMKDVYEAVGNLEAKIEDKFVRKNEVRLWIIVGLLGGNTIASIITAYVTNLSPAQQVHAAAQYVSHFL